MRHKTLGPTEAELEILQILWEDGPSTVRHVHQAISGRRNTGYTTVLKLLQIMSEKGLVRRDESHRAHVYSVEMTMEQTQQTLLSHLMDKVFGNSMSSLVMRALSTKGTSREELAKIRELLDEMEGDLK